MNEGEIRDPIHGNISFNSTEAKIIDTPEMQRLRYIRQLDTAHLIFPGANHTRFEHSIGTMHVTKELVNGVYGGNAAEFPYVGLIHDIGHGPFSHLTEPLMEKYMKMNHEQIGEGIIRNSGIKDIISDSGVSFGKVMDYFKNVEMIDVVGGALGSDRIDYLMRDSHYTGVAYGIIDYDRIKGRLVAHNEKIALLESGISGAESMLIARYFMHSNVYAHHAKLISSRMLYNAVELCLEDGALDAKPMSRMHDEQLIRELLGSGVEEVVGLITRLMERRLFKRAYYKSIDKDIDVGELQNAIEKAGLRRNEYVVLLKKLGGSKDDIEVVDNSGASMGRLTELSPFIKTLNGVLANYRKLLVACDRGNMDKVSAVVRRFVD